MARVGRRDGTEAPGGVPGSAGSCDNRTAMHADPAKLHQFATRYTAAWCSQSAANVASFFATDGSLKINAASPSVGRQAITAAAQGFITDFPELKSEVANT